MTTTTITERLARVRAELANQGLDALYVPSADPHLSEYLPERWQGRVWLSGFTGSAGTLAITATSAALFTDSRYWVQAEAELRGSGIDLIRQGQGDAPSPAQWLCQQLQAGQTVCADGQVMALGAAQSLQTALNEAGIGWRTDIDVLATVWSDRPGLPDAPVYEHEPQWAEQTRADKLAQIRGVMGRQGISHHLISTVDDIAWLTNLRGSDVNYNPVFLGHLLLSAEAATLFAATGKISAKLAARLAQDGIQVADYGHAAQSLSQLPGDALVLMDPKRVTLGMRQALPTSVRVKEAINPSTLFKSRKTAAQAAHIRQAMAHDGAAQCEFYAWFEQQLERQARGELPPGSLTELAVDEHLSAARARQPHFVGLSFPVIAGFNANGAMPHYRATPESHAAIAGDGLLLIDSGGQYLGGTTDITRVWAIGTPSAAMKRDYTLVLKGTMALSRARFPQGTLSPMLDAIARAPLWAEGLDFGHGTGHGVGYFLNVHEGPQSISKAIPEPHMAMQPGMITSIEPGVYRPGQWGIRIENLVLNVATDTAEGGAFGDMLAFETLSLCPIDTRCIERSLLRDDEVAWLNAYHVQVRERLAPLVSGEALAWLNHRTEPLL
jgi:Xaa-Pro aminopeptidase